jgi:hypothetical protein
MRAWHPRLKIVEKIWNDDGMRIGAAHLRLVEVELMYLHLR